jgi:hypothetical protein
MSGRIRTSIRNLTEQRQANQRLARRLKRTAGADQAGVAATSSEAEIVAAADLAELKTATAKLAVDMAEVARLGNAIRSSNVDQDLMKGS